MTPVPPLTFHDQSVPWLSAMGAGLLAGAVLAGGRSRRMGRDKARLIVDGQELWRRQLTVLAEAGAQPLMIVRRPGQDALTSGVAQVWDRVADSGPLAGLHAALRASEMPFVALLAIDMPAIDAGWFRWLARHCSAGRGAVAWHAGGYEPLAAIYPRDAEPDVATRVERRELAMCDLVRSLVAAGRMAEVSVPPEWGPCCANWNFPGDVVRSPAAL